LEPLRQTAMFADDSAAQRRSALQKMADLRAAVRPSDALSLLKAGYWIAILHDIGVTDDTGGHDLILQAAQLRPNDPEYQFFAALASFDTDKEQYQRHWARAVALTKPGSAVSRNLREFEPELLTRAK
jgi:hypothetical protein